MTPTRRRRRALAPSHRPPPRPGARPPAAPATASAPGRSARPRARLPPAPRAATACGQAAAPARAVHAPRRRRVRRARDAGHPVASAQRRSLRSDGAAATTAHHSAQRRAGQHLRSQRSRPRDLDRADVGLRRSQARRRPGARTPSKLAPVVGVDQQTLYERLSDKSHRFVYIARTVDDATDAEGRATLGLAGVGVRSRVAAPVSRRQRRVRRSSGASAAKASGSTGSRRYYDDELQGQAGRGRRRA